MLLLIGGSYTLRNDVYFFFRKMYWSDWGESPHISVADMDGSNRQFFIKDNIVWPNGLTIDYPNKRLYWVDAKLKVIESVQLDGTDRRVSLRWSIFIDKKIMIINDILVQ